MNETGTNFEKEGDEAPPMAEADVFSITGCWSSDTILRFLNEKKKEEKEKDLGISVNSH